MPDARSRARVESSLVGPMYDEQDCVGLCAQRIAPIVEGEPRAAPESLPRLAEAAPERTTRAMRLLSWPAHGRRGPAVRLAAQYLRFGLVGGLATVTYVGLFAGLIELAGLAPLLASLVAFPTAVGVSFVGHYGWTFAPERKGGAAPPRVRRAFVKFVMVALVGLGLNSVVVYVVTESLALSYLYAIVLMVTVVPVVLFLLNKYWAFRAPDL